MDLQDFKRWHWAVLGVLVGLALSYAFSDHDVDTDASMRDREIKQPVFERSAFSRSRESHEPILQNVVVEPPVLDYLHHSKQIVVGQRLQYSEKYQKEFRVPFYYYADDPYVPLMVPVNVDASSVKNVMDYLALAQKTLGPPAQAQVAQPWQGSTGLRYRFGWEYQSKWNTVLWIAGGLVVIGGLWPTFLSALVGAGFGRVKTSSKDDAYLSRFGTGKSPPSKAVAVVNHDAERRRLDELNAALEAGLAPSGIHATNSTNANDDSGVLPAVAKLQGTDAPPDIAAPEKAPELSEEEIRRRYAAGDFYPVARGPVKKPSE